MSDLAKRLRAHDLNISPEWDEANDQHLWCDTADALLSEAADEIDKLTAELAEAREKALEEAARAAEATHEEAPEDEQLGDEFWSLRVSCNTRSAQIARKIRALKEKP